MRLLFFTIFAYILIFSSVEAQRFSEDKTQFRAQAIAKLRAVGTEPAKKIAFDFRNAWDAKFTSDQQKKAHRIALIMQKKGYKYYPFFYHYFTYLAYSVAQENLQRDQLSAVLEINEQVVHTLLKTEYKEFLFGLNIFFARRYLSLDKNLSVQALDGSYHFKLIDQSIEGSREGESAGEGTESFSSEEGIAEINENTDTSGFDDMQDTNDSWGSSDDSWGSSDDSWGSSDDSSDNSGQEQVYEKPVAARPNYAPVIYDYVAQRKSQYRTPEIVGPIIELLSTNIILSTRDDTLKIKNVNGSFLLQNRTLIGKQGSLEWPAANTKFKGAVVQFSDFHIRKNRSDFWTPNATLQFNQLIGNGRVEGIFEFRSKVRPARTLSSFPIFTSNYANVTVKMNDEKLKYTGGIQLKGNKLFGRSVSREEGTLKILDGRGNMVVLKSKNFLLGDSLVSMDNGSFSILHGSDSIHHKSVRAKYDLTKRELKILRNSTSTPYFSSYFDVYMNVDLIIWNMAYDSISLEIMNGKDLLPATFESKDFFNEARYNRMAHLLDFHPINAAVLYALRYDVEDFYVGEMGLEYGINEHYAKAAGKLLSQHGFALYNEQTGHLKLYPKAFLYYYASAKKVDFDNLLIASKIKDGSNALIQLDSGKLNIRGVSRFHFTSNFKLYAQPEDSTITLLKGRNLEFDGKIKVGDFEYKGVGHQFDYEEFLVNMPQIDSIRLSLSINDSTNANSERKTTSLKNEVSETSGVLYLDTKDNKSGTKKNDHYPDFVSNSEAVIYFDGKEILDGAYDKSVKFLIPPFQVDSLAKENGESVSFEGTFNSGGIFPSFDETLRVQEDISLGFRHQIPPEGYNLYGTEAKTYREIKLNNKGLRGYGKIDFLTTTIYSDDFIYYPDSVATDGTSGVISPGDYNGASFPEAVLGIYDMSWLPRKDSMYLRTVTDPFKFYNATAELEGEANITTSGVYGKGTLISRGSQAISNELNFEEFEYGARHAQFEVFTNDLSKSAMTGDDVHLTFDLINNKATVSPETVGVASLSFPYSQMKTSITEAVWDLIDSVVTMTKPPNIPIEDSYFYTTREELDSLVFNAEKAVYDINTQELNIQGIPYIIVADSKIIPEGNETTILANSVLQRFENAKIIIDTLNGYHYLDRASIRVISRNKFEGNAFYKHIVDQDTFHIRFDGFELKDVPIGEPDRKGRVETKKMTVSGGFIPERQNLIISPGFFYKGTISIYATRLASDLDGFVKLNLADPEYNYWVRFERIKGEKDVHLIVDDAVFEDETDVAVGIYSNIRDELYTTFIAKKDNPSDSDFFEASGVLTYNDSLKTYRIEHLSKTSGDTYAGSTMRYNDLNKSIIFEGSANFVNPINDQIKVESSILGVGNSETMELTVDAMMTLELSIPPSSMEIMATDLSDIIERLGSPEANTIALEFLLKLANFTSDATARRYEESSLKNYVSLVSISQNLEKPLLISGVKMKWDNDKKAWHNTSKIGLSNIYKNDINAKVNGFFEIKKDETGADIINLFLQTSPGIWYYISYTTNQLILYSSNPAFNEDVQAMSNKDKSRSKDWVLALGDESETLEFINTFRLHYFGVKEPYNLVSPDDVELESENFDTIEKDDDGFGF